MELLEPLDLGPRQAPNRVMFGPHVTNLGDDDRRLTDRHVAYYERRARGGCGTIVVEGASVHESDWPYERAPLAERCGPGWAEIAGRCRPHGALVLASLDHAGGQGSSAYNQAPLWAPSRVADVNSREVPKWMEPDDIAAVVDGFAAAAAIAVESDLDGVEINIGQHSLIRQFLSGLTNERDDEYGADRSLFAHRVIEATRTALGSERTLGLRLSCDELAPWAGVTPEVAADLGAELVGAGGDYLVVVRGSIYSVSKTRQDFHDPAGFNIDLCRSVRATVRSAHPGTPVILQGSIVESGQAEWALGGYDDPALCDAVEMTRAHIADPDVIDKLRSDAAARIRPCTLCNQTCQVRDPRNPLVTCVGEPTSGHETEDPDWYEPTERRRRVLVIGAGPAGLEAARVASLRGHDVTVVDRAEEVGGMALVAGPHRPLVEWYRREHERLGTDIRLGVGEDVPADLDASDLIAIQCTGSQPGRPAYEIADGATVLDIGALRTGAVLLPADGPVVVFDPIGGPIAVALAEELGSRAVLVTPDNIAGNELSRTGDLAGANTRLQQGGVTIVRRAVLRTVRPGPQGVIVDLDDRFSGRRTSIDAAALVDCGFRLPTEPIPGVQLRAGDAVAPRTVLEAVLEGRRVASSI